MSILGAIANPQMADIAGALDIRQQRLDADEARRKEIRLGQLLAEALPNMREGSPLYEMAQQSPREFAVFAKALGVPLNAGDKMQELADDVSRLYTVAQDDPFAAVELAQNLKEQRNAAGRETPQLDKWLASVQEDPQTAFTSLFTMHRSIGDGQEKPAGQREFESLTEGLSEDEVMQARRVKLGLAGRASGAGAQTFRMRGADGRERAYRFDPQTGSLEAFDGQQWNMAGQADQRQYDSGEAQMTPIDSDQPEAQGELDRSDLFVGRSEEQVAQAKAERTPPAGFRLVDEPDGSTRLEPIPGGPADIKRKEGESQEANKRRRERALATVVVQDLDRAESLLDQMGSGFTATQLRSRLSDTPGTKAHDLNQLIEASRATVSLQNLQELKETTGAGLGNVSDRQSELLASAYGSIKMSQSNQQLQDSIRRARNIYLDIIFGHNKGPERKPLSFQDQWEPMDDGWVDDDGNPIPTFGQPTERTGTINWSDL